MRSLQSCYGARGARAFERVSRQAARAPRTQHFVRVKATTPFDEISELCLTSDKCALLVGGRKAENGTGFPLTAT